MCNCAMQRLEGKCAAAEELAAASNVVHAIKTLHADINKLDGSKCNVSQALKYVNNINSAQCSGTHKRSHQARIEAYATDKVRRYVLRLPNNCACASAAFRAGDVMCVCRRRTNYMLVGREHRCCNICTVLES